MSASKDAKYVAPTSPAAYLMWHILKKGFQAGGVLGVGAVVPTLFFYKKIRSPAALIRAVGYCATTLTAGSGIMGALKFMQIDQTGFEDRVYRLHYNSGQKRTDDFSTVGALFGLAAAAVLVPRAGGGAATAYGMMLLGGAAVGSAAGIVAHVASTPKELK